MLSSTALNGWSIPAAACNAFAVSVSVTPLSDHLSELRAVAFNRPHYPSSGVFQTRMNNHAAIYPGWMRVTVNFWRVMVGFENFSKINKSCHLHYYTSTQTQHFYVSWYYHMKLSTTASCRSERWLMQICNWVKAVRSWSRQSPCLIKQKFFGAQPVPRLVAKIQPKSFVALPSHGTDTICLSSDGTGTPNSTALKQNPAAMALPVQHEVGTLWRLTHHTLIAQLSGIV